MPHGEAQVPQWAQNLLLVVCGNNWPTGNEEDMRALAGDWERAAVHLHTLTANLNAGAQRVHAGIEGATEQAFQQYIAAYTADDGFLDVLAEVCVALGDGLRSMAYEVETLRYMIVLQLVWLAAQLIVDAIAAFFTGGLTTLVATAAIQATRAAVLTLLRRAILKIVAYVVESTVLQVGFDVIAQFLVCVTSEGNFSRFSSKQVENAAKNGAFGGLLGGGMGLLGGLFSAGVKNGLAGGIALFTNKGFKGVDDFFNGAGLQGWKGNAAKFAFNLPGNVGWGALSGTVMAAGQDWIVGNPLGADTTAGAINGAFGGLAKGTHGWLNPKDRFSFSMGDKLDKWMNGPFDKPGTLPSPPPPHTPLPTPAPTPLPTPSPTPPQTPPPTPPLTPHPTPPLTPPLTPAPVPPPTPPGTPPPLDPERYGLILDLPGPIDIGAILAGRRTP